MELPKLNVLMPCMYVQSFRTLWTPWNVACQAPLSMGFSMQDYWRALPFPPPGGTQVSCISCIGRCNTLKERPFDCVHPQNRVFLKGRGIPPAEVQGIESRITELQQAQICNISYTPTSPLALMVASSTQAKMLVTWSLTT